MKRMSLLRCVILSATFCAAAQQAPAQNPATPETIQVDTRAAGHPFPHFWEQMFGSGTRDPLAARRLPAAICAK